jgi:hypothetical protein
MTFIQTSLEKLVASIAKASEVVSNKATSRSATPGDIKYPSEKLVFDTIDNLLNINIVITSPTPGQTFLQGETRNISFTATAIDYVKISYSVDNGATWIVLTSHFANNGTPYSWVIPSIIVPNVQIKIENVDRADEHSITFCNIDLLTIASSPTGKTQLTGNIAYTYFNWGTNYPSDSLVYWGVDSGSVINALPKDTSSVLYHSIVTIPTQVQITIYFYVVSATAYGASATSGILSFFSSIGGFKPNLLSDAPITIKLDDSIPKKLLSDGTVTATITAS